MYSKPIGEAKFLRLMPETQLNEIEDEESHREKVFYPSNPHNSTRSITTYYNINC